MSNLIELTNVKLPTLPSSMQDLLEEASTSLEIPGGGTFFPRISSNRRKFSIVESGVDPVMITDDEGKPVDHLDVVILCANKGMYRSFYAGAYDSKAKEKEGPVCWSPDGVAPHPAAKEPQSKTCATCKNAVYGSKITEQKKKSFACSESKRLLVLSPNDLGGKIFMINVSYSAHKALRSYLANLKKHNVYSLMVETRLSFDEEWDVPVFQFNFIQMLDQSAVNVVAARLEEEEVQNFIKGISDTETDAPRTVAENDDEVQDKKPEPEKKAESENKPEPEKKASISGFGSKKVETAKEQPVEENAAEPTQEGDGDLAELMDF